MKTVEGKTKPPPKNFERAGIRRHAAGIWGKKWIHPVESTSENAGIRDLAPKTGSDS